MFLLYSKPSYGEHRNGHTGNSRMLGARILDRGLDKGTLAPSGKAVSLRNSSFAGALLGTTKQAIPRQRLAERTDFLVLLSWRAHSLIKTQTYKVVFNGNLQIFGAFRGPKNLHYPSCPQFVKFVEASDCSPSRMGSLAPCRANPVITGKFRHKIVIYRASSCNLGVSKAKLTSLGPDHVKI